MLNQTQLILPPGTLRDERGFAPMIGACGAEDRVCPPELSKKIAACIPGATLAVVERAGHYLTLDQPQAMARLLCDWLAAPTPVQTRKVPEEFS